MARFVMASRRAGKFQDREKRAARRAMDESFGLLEGRVNLLSDSNPDDQGSRRVAVFDADPVEMELRSEQLPADVIVEPEILHWEAAVMPRDLQDMQRQPQAGPEILGGGTALTVRVTGSGQPLEGAEVLLFLQGFGGFRHRMEGLTNAGGEIDFEFSFFFQPLGVIVTPAGGFWDVLVRGGSGTVDVDCPPLPADGPHAWWHEVLNLGDFEVTRGEGIRVGVIDSGVGPHPNLGHVTDIGSFINGLADPAGGADSGSHGSHVCGTIGARPTNGGDYAGIAPGVALFSARVFPPGQGANQGDIVQAIDALSRDHQADLINMSLGAPVGSEIERDAIQDALERGTLCVCAAANSAGPVEFPAAFDETVAISALGRLGWGPPGSQASMVVPQEADRFGDDQLYLADFSCFGPEVTAGAPGVGIISTVPARHGLQAPYGAMNGTSMASPAACGALAVLLASDAAYQGLPRSQIRAERARTLLRTNCLDIGLDSDFQGHGVPQVPVTGGGCS